jgi:hypothetical protein
LRGFHRNASVFPRQHITAVSTEALML